MAVSTSEQGSVSTALNVTRSTLSNFMSDRSFRVAAAMAYYLMMSLAPIILIAVGVIELIWGRRAAEGEVFKGLATFIGSAAADVVHNLLGTAGKRKQGTLAIVIGAVTLVTGATGVFVQFHRALNTVWKVRVKPGRGMWAAIRERLLSNAMVIGLVLMLLALLAIDAV